MSEIYKTNDELLNIALLLTLESSGHVFFEKVVKQVKKAGENENLKYFSFKSPRCRIGPCLV